MARRLRCGRRFRALAALLLVLAAAGASATVSARPRAVAPALEIRTPNEVRARVPIEALAVDGTHAAYKLCINLLSVWRPGRNGAIVRIGPPAQHRCGLYPRAVYTFALSADRLAYMTDEGGIQVHYHLWRVDLRRPRVIRHVTGASRCCRGDPLGYERMGWLLGDRTLLAFSNFVVCGEVGTPSCGAGPRRVLSQATWRLRRPGVGGVCPERPGPCRLLVAARAPLEPLSVGQSRIVLRRPTGVLDVRNARGRLVRTFAAISGTPLAAELYYDRLVVLVSGAILDYSISTGRLLHRWPVLALPGGPGWCGLSPCTRWQLALDDTARGLVAYRAQDVLHLLRLRDGRDVTIRAATAARFGSRGLFYAYVAAGPRPGRLRFVPFARLPLRP